MHKVMMLMLGTALQAAAILQSPGAALAAPTGIAIIEPGERQDIVAPEYPAIIQRCALNAYRPTTKGKSIGGSGSERNAGKRSPSFPDWGGKLRRSK